MAGEDQRAEEIIIVRRKGGGEEEGHHGGAWKIAFADFMTAMMAFFLVMWLVNASNAEMKASVASYFNPIKLTESVSRKKGLREMDEKSPPAEAPKSDPKAEPKADPKQETSSAKPADKKSKDKSAGGAAGAAEEMQRLALNFDKSSPAVQKNDKDARSAAAAESGKAFRDPFNPLVPGSMLRSERKPGDPADNDVKSAAVPPKGEKGGPGQLEALERSQDGASPSAAPSKEQSQAASNAAAAGNVAMLERRIEREGAVKPTAGEAAAIVKPDGDAKPADGAKEAGKAGPSEQAASKAAERISALAKANPDTPAADSGQLSETELEGARAAAERAASAAKLLGEVSKASQQLGIKGGPGIEVTVESEGIVISLTDTSTFGMFGVGSSNPNDDLVKLMRTIAPLVQNNGDSVVVRGHTDGRQYRTGSVNNNWRLSLARAESVYSILVRAGVDEKRIERIEAHADRKLRQASEPEAATNRRIEILLKQARKS